ncbi:replication-relaxation family protein [Streptococcus anginosus]|uniref:Replication-relaxation family protein n=2 Tax=Streptococcus TaxID=1301 RepID=A0ABD4U660_STRAP|nr:MULTISPECIES: replication-relaxation family protein [Streptococcus]MCW1077354.1 replication-relaxation family protein [Streptococcus anginosus]MDB8656531.1 replication-relaxation family protein [Streptococcus anginosus]MDB8660046.1 replication-relaxation family protein [Streptococcus anginosus]MDB8664612.1 replication-relaxation family protein [Streptococcus anginosus]MDX5026253.1 replication-relaxation family protein [Streptococcus anginosus]
MSKLQIIHSHRFSNRHAKQSAQHRRLRAKFAHDLYRNSIRYFYHGGKLMTNQQWEVLHFLADARMATSSQIAHLIFANFSTQRARIRRANLITKQLKEAGLIYHQPRKIGGWTKGSASYIWSLTYKGFKKLKEQDESISLRFRNKVDFSRNHIEHTLAITEIFVELKELERLGKIQIEEFCFEPKSWRYYSDIGGSSLILKPDAFAKITVGEYEDFFFFELDRSSESPTRIVNTCKKYIHYYNTGIEQRINEVFPFVLWIVPDERRKQNITNVIHSKLNNF